MAEQSLSFHVENPRACLSAAFADIAATRMAGLPVINPKLSVSVPAMRNWKGDWVGVLITPWAINLVVLPGCGGVFKPLEFGACQQWSFPSGDYEFLGLREEGLGFYQSCSLLSPVFEFSTQDSAEVFALAALQALLEPANKGLDSSEAVHQIVQGRDEPVSSGAETISRRGFLLGRRT